MYPPFRNEKNQKLHLAILQGGNYLKNVHARVVVLMHGTSSECAFQMYEVLLKYLLWLSSYRTDTIL